MIWDVYNYNVNAGRIEKYNIFNHSGFHSEFLKLKARRLPKDAFEYELERLIMYYFWSKVEYEIIISGLFSGDARGQKIDIYNQIKMNWQAFVDYCIGRASPCQIGDKVWFVRGDEDPIEATVNMLTQKADRTWKIRITYNHGSSIERTEADVGRTIFYGKEAAEKVAQFHKRISEAKRTAADPYPEFF